jgi:sortase A
VKNPRHRIYAAVSLTAAFLSFCFLIQALWIPVKAELAQWLIERSWQQQQSGKEPLPPWPWADTYPVAALEVPGEGLKLLVLQGHSGRNLAFGPVLLGSSTGGRDFVISGHRDTHFRFLQSLRVGDRIRLTTNSGGQWFEVAQTEVVDSRNSQILIEPEVERISLVTCYPFDSPSAGGPLRYVVTALPATSSRPRSLSSG